MAAVFRARSCKCGPLRLTLGCFLESLKDPQLMAFVQWLHPLSWLLLNICTHTLNRWIIRTNLDKWNKVLMAQLSQGLENYHKSTDSSPPKTMLYCYEGLLSDCWAYLSKSVTKESVYVCVHRCGNKRSGQEADVQCRAHG